MLFGKNQVVDAASKPGIKFNRFKSMSLGSKISLIVIAILAFCAVFARS